MPIRILHIIAGMGSGGAEAMIMNWYRNIDRNKVQFDFLLRSDENIYADEIKKLGGEVYYTAEYPKSYLKNKRQTVQFFKQHASKYTAIHVHCNALLYTNIFNIAKKYGIKTRIIHSHSTHTKNRLFEMIHKFNKRRIHKKATCFFACSPEAGDWAFNKKIEYQIITNGIDAERFKYKANIRERIRKEWGLENNRIIGHVGRFLDVKNHIFLLEVFEKIIKQWEDAVLILIGTGPLENKIKTEVKNRGLEDKVRFLGVRKDVNDIYSAMDIFAFPSKYEGLSVALIEAQTNGLYCFVSENIPKTNNITGCIDFLPITNAKIWEEKIITNKIKCDRENLWKQTVELGFDIKSNAKMLQGYYLRREDD